MVDIYLFRIANFN